MIFKSKGTNLKQLIRVYLHGKQNRYFCSTYQIEQLKDKVSQNCIFDLLKRGEKEWNEQIDESFRVYPIVLQLQKHEEKALSEQYYNLLDFLSSKKKSKNFADEVNAQLINWISERTFKNLSENYLKIERISTANKNSSQSKQFHLLHRGHLQIFGVEMDRSQNDFIHKYTFQKNSAELKFTRRLTSQEKIDKLELKDILPEELQGKTTKMKKQIEEILNKDPKEIDENASGGLRGTFLKMANKLGYDFKDNNINAADYVNKFSEYKQKTFQSMRQKEEYILVEDFQLRTTESIRIKALSGDILWEDQPDANGLYHHYLRTEATCDLNEAPSVKNDRKRVIADIDATLRGNPPCLVKRFDILTPN